MAGKLPDFVKVRKVPMYLCLHPNHNGVLVGFLTRSEIEKHVKDQHSEPNDSEWSKAV